MLPHSHSHSILMNSLTLKKDICFSYLFSPLQYGIVIDSGSSRSNVYLYEWPGEKENETGVVTEVLNCRVEGESQSQKQNK